MANEPQKLTSEQIAEMKMLQTTQEDRLREDYIEFKAALREACILPVLCIDEDKNYIVKYYRFKESKDGWTQKLLDLTSDKKTSQTVEDTEQATEDTILTIYDIERPIENIASSFTSNVSALNFDVSINSKVGATLSWFLRCHRLDFLAKVIQEYVSNSDNADYSEKPVEEEPIEELILKSSAFYEKEKNFTNREKFVGTLLESLEVEELPENEVYSLLHDEDLSGNSEERRFSNNEIKKFMFQYARHNKRILFESNLRNLFKCLQLPEKQKTKRLIPVINKTGFYPEADCYEVQE